MPVALRRDGILTKARTRALAGTALLNFATKLMAGAMSGKQVVEAHIISPNSYRYGKPGFSFPCPRKMSVVLGAKGAGAALLGPSLGS